MTHTGGIGAAAAAINRANEAVRGISAINNAGGISEAVAAMARANEAARGLSVMNSTDALGAAVIATSRANDAVTTYRVPYPTGIGLGLAHAQPSPPKAVVASGIRKTDLHSIRSPADLGTLIRTAREARRLSQQDFADLAGVGRRFLSELENGKATVELGKVLLVLAAAGIDLSARKR
jgi:HTH-type transcriptional regulator/antitoxin HipB